MAKHIITCLPGLAPGGAAAHAKHCAAVSLLVIMQTSHVHSSSARLNISDRLGNFTVSPCTPPPTHSLNVSHNDLLRLKYYAVNANNCCCLCYLQLSAETPMHSHSANGFFQRVADDLSPLNNCIILLPSEVIPYEFTISQADVEHKLSQSNVHKTSGPNWLLCDFSTHIASPVCAIYNASVREVIPS